ncbi:MAG: prolyl oligopeptidase family serine peptidase [Rhodobacteraceae bacterium]|nr:prolyl oligopeptidase family serine peptidase [Paracoccaceae bacterium]
MTTLKSDRRAAKSGTAKTMMIFLHGYGADGKDLLGLADPLGEHLPDTVFVAPNAPDRCTGNPMGFQWFPIPWLDGSSEEAAEQGLLTASQTLNDWLDETLKTEGVSAANTIIFGFSQGTMITLHVCPQRAEPFAGLVGFSGRLLHPEQLADAVSKPPILLVHGDMDDVVPPSSMPEAADALTAAGFQVYTHVSQGTGHGIAQDGLGVTLQFARQQFGLA